MKKMELQDKHNLSTAASTHMLEVTEELLLQ